MTRIVVLMALGFWLAGCQPEAGAPVSGGTPGAMSTGVGMTPAVSKLADYQFDLSIWGGSSVTFSPAYSSVRVSSGQHLDYQGAWFVLQPAQARELEEVLSKYTEVIQRLGSGAGGGQPLVGMEHESIRYVASCQHPELAEVEKALKPYIPLAEGVGPGACWIVGRLTGVKTKKLVLVSKGVSYSLSGTIGELKCRDGMNVMAVGRREGAHGYRLTMATEWKGSMALEEAPPQFPDQEGDPPTQKEFVQHDGIVTSRIRLRLILRGKALPKDLPGILRCADPQAHLASCWPELKIMTVVIPDSPDLKKVRAAVARLSKHPMVENAMLFEDIAGSSSAVPQAEPVSPIDLSPQQPPGPGPDRASSN